MKFVSLQKLSLLSLSLFTLCFMGFANDAQAEFSSDEIPGLRYKCRSSNKCDNFRHTEGVVLSKDVINAFVLRFSEAVRAGGDDASILRLEETLDVKGGYSISLVFGSIIIGPATNFEELQQLIQSQSSALFDVSLNANLSVECYSDRMGQRTLQIQGVEYVVQKVTECLSNLIIASDQWTVVETKNNNSRKKDDRLCNSCVNPFKVKILVATVLNVLPICTTGDCRENCPL